MRRLCHCQRQAGAGSGRPALTCAPPCLQAGGGGALGGLTDSILEVPSYVLALVFLFFAAVSILFERAVHFLRHRFIKAGRWGLVEALNSLVLELTMLGFISLLLITFQKPLEKLCGAD